jgi:ATP-dependent exoDNAse (exonuclease V) beta subunit
MPELFLVPQPVAAPSARPRDDGAARRTALDITRSFIVEAPAGSGKTGLLIQRFLMLLAAENVTDPAQVLAITFTRKATVEMRDRVVSQLQAASSNAEPRNEFDRLTRPLALAVLEHDRRLGWSLLDYPRRLNIRTIDSISADIARSLPVLSGSSGALAPTEQSGPLYTEAARRTLMLLGADDPALTNALETILLHRDANLANVESLIAEMLEWRDQWGELIPIAASELDDAYLESTVLPKLERALDQAICRGLTRLSDSLPESFLLELAALASEWGRLDGHPSNPSPIALCAGKNSAPEAVAAHLDHWRALIGLLLTKEGEFRKAKGIHKGTLKFLMEKQHRDELATLIDQVRHDEALRETLCSVNSLPPAKYPENQWPVTKALFRVLSRALVELQLVFAEHGECDFAELGLLARTALHRDAAASTEQSDLHLATGLNLQHLLVDEMQDTSTSQYELIQLLTQRWDGHSQTVFLVGDPKQSIYLFRQARVERFVQTMLHGTLGDVPVTPLQLTANFRSQAHLVTAFNDDFTRLFPAESDPAQPELVPYLPARAARAPGSKSARHWHTAPLPYSDDAALCAEYASSQRLQTARQIRGLIEDAQARPLPPGRTDPWKIAILVRSRNHLTEIVAALKQPTPIPYRAVEIEPLGERQEILDLLALTRALLHPADRTAWLALLRTPWCGLALADLHTLAGSDDLTLRTRTLFELIETRGDLLSDDAISRMTPFYTVLRAALAQRGRLPLAHWVERTWRSFHAHRFASPEELDNITRFLTLLGQLELPGGRLDLELLASRLKRLYASPAVHPGAVDLMTIHGSKGLEWDVVFLPALERKAPPARTRLLSWLEVDGASDLHDDSVAHGILAPIQSKGTASQELNTWMRCIESAREAAERKRLFYVACTRAREELHLFAAPARKKGGELSIERSSLLHSAWPAAEERFLNAPTPLLQMPLPTFMEDFGADVPRLAASATPQPRTISRIPLNSTPALAPSLPHARPETPPSPLFERPEGSFAARAFGNAVHAFLEQLTLRRALGDSFALLTQELPAWLPRITHSLRASGLAPTHLDRFAQRIFAALRNTLTDPYGQWILTPHPHAASESSLTFGAGDPSTIRMDRTFRAGPVPLSTGDTHLWVIDYKTAHLGGRNLDQFLAEEREKYAPQMNSYAEAFAAESHPIRLALYYPLLPALISCDPALELAAPASVYSHS